MAETIFQALSPLAAYGPGTSANLRLREIRGRALVNLLAHRTNVPGLKQAVRRHFGLDLPTGPKLVRNERLALLWSGHHQWLVVSEGHPGDLAEQLGVLRESGAAIIDQSDARVILELSGPYARRTLAKLTPIDLHPRAFQAGDTALSLFGHIGGQIAQVNDEPTYEIMAFRSMARNLWHALSEAGAEFGIGGSLPSETTGRLRT